MAKPFASFLVVVVVIAVSAADQKADSTLAGQLARLDSNVFPSQGDKAKALAQMLGQDVRARRTAVNQRDTEAWHKVQSRADWERFRDGRIQALRASLGQFPPVPKDLKVRVTRTLEGDGHRIENLVFESRPGVAVTANLYSPRTPARSEKKGTGPLKSQVPSPFSPMPGILICHSHHTPKTQSELQDMGVNWARLGCLVLIMDQLGHGERRQHPFVDEKSYPGPFRVSRQDYYFRYNVANQLHLAGESLIGWMAWDLMRGVDLLLARPGIDKERILLLGAVAGGGDPAAVTAALDPRITMAAPFNFGGPQPETRYPLPADAEKSFNYIGGGSWESTRNLRLSARDGFLPWVIVGSLAPRRLIYAHEFAWDYEHDPVWARFGKIYDFYGVRDHLSSVTGRGAVTGKPPTSTHCTHIGPEHRKQIYPALKRWFNIPEPQPEVQQRRPAEELMCLTPEVAAAIKPRPVYELAAELGAERAASARKQLPEKPAARRQALRREWARLLGDIEPRGTAKAIEHHTQQLGDVMVERLALEVEPRIVVPLVLLTPPHQAGARLPVVVGFAQEGKQAMLAKRLDVIAELLRHGAAVCLPDLRGTGETRPADDSRGRASVSTSLSASELMLGQTLLGSRLRDLRSVLRFLRARADLDAARLALWGDSFAPVNPPDRNLRVPWDAEKLPDQSEPLGGLLALFGALFEGDVKAVSAHAGLAGFQYVLHSPFLYVPHDVLIPGALTAGDLGDVAAALAPRPIRLTGLVDGLNRRASAELSARAFEPARAAYRATGAQDRFQIEPDRDPPGRLATWLVTQIK